MGTCCSDCGGQTPDERLLDRERSASAQQGAAAAAEKRAAAAAPKRKATPAPSGRLDRPAMRPQDYN
jgi:hypothetical protein